MRKSLFLKSLFFIFCIQFIAHHSAISDPDIPPTFGSPEDPFPEATTTTTIPGATTTTTTTTSSSTTTTSTSTTTTTIPCPAGTFLLSSGFCGPCPDGQYVQVEAPGGCCLVGQVFEARACRPPCVAPNINRYADGTCHNCPELRPVLSNGICCPSITPFNLGGVCSVCDLGQRLVSGVCKENCHKLNFHADTGIDGSFAFQYKNTSGTRKSCLENKIMEIFTSLYNNPAANTGKGALNRPVFNSTTGQIDVTGRKWADDTAVRMLWFYLVQEYRQYPCCLAENIKNNYTQNKGFIHCNANWPRTNGDQPANGFGGGYTGENGAGNACYGGNFVLDSDCKLVLQSDLNAICGTTFVGTSHIEYDASTPISLILDETYDIEKNVSFVSIPLSLNSDKKFWTWKGSAKTPLLVYDPQGKRTVTSATQLFGSWTFGGQRLASLLHSDADSLQAKPWNNGFEALATLDANYDGEISGDELKPLALWFDQNKNAVSEEGEIKDIRDVGIKALYYKVDRIDTKNKAVEVSKGFAKKDNGKTIFGRAVDWSSEGADSQYQLFSKYILENANNISTVIPKKEDTNTARDNKEHKKGDQEATASIANGIWSWNLKESPDLKLKNGIFFLGTKGNVLKGHTLMEIPIAVFQGEDYKENTIVLFSQIKGSKKDNSDGTVSLEFESSSNRGNIKNNALVSADGSSIIGSSVAKISENGIEKNFTYSWEAKRTKLDKLNQGEVK